MKGLEAKTLGLKKMIRHEYKRIVAFMLTVAMVVTNFGTNLTVALAAGEETSSLFLLDSSELEDAISTALESGEVFDFSSLELKAKQKSLKTSYEKLIGSKAGKVYQLDVDVDSSYASENTDLQVFYNAGTDSVVFLFINESDMAVTFRANVSGYETARVTVNPNTSNIEDAEGVENAEDYSGTTMVDDEKKPQAEVVKPEGETSESESTSDETEAAETEADVTESENASENGEAEETTGAEKAAETETSEAAETEAETEPETEAEAPAADEAEKEIELTPEEGSASASISAKKVFRVSTSAEAAGEAPAADAEEETEAEEPEKETEAPVETTAEETVADDSTEETIADETQEDETTAADETDGELTDETEAPTEDVTAPDETNGEEPADNGGSENIGFDNDEQFLEDDSIELAGELNGKAYNTVTIWGSANARAYVVKAEDLTGEAAVEGQYSVDYSVDPVGAATIKGAHTVNEGETLYFAVDPQVGYEITEVTANGEDVEEVDAAGVASASNLTKYEHVYAVAEVTEDLEIVATLEEIDGVAHPEFNASYVSSDGVTISLHAEEGILPEGTELEVTEVTAELGDTIKEKMESESEGAAVNTVLAYDINLLYDGNKLDNSWSENGYVDVTFTGAPIQEMSESADTVEIVAVDDTSATKLSAENAAEVEASELKLETVGEQNVEGTAVDEVGFKAEHFTIYAVTGSYYWDADVKLKNMTIYVGDSLIIYTSEAYGDGQWSSSNPDIADVKSTDSYKWRPTATLTAKTAGKTKITCSYYNDYGKLKSDSATITVKDQIVSATKLELPETATVVRNSNITITPTVLEPQNAIITWTTSDSSIATVNANGQVTGVKPGTVTIAAQSGTLTASTTVTVTGIYTYDKTEFYYLKTPTSDKDSNSKDQWGKQLGGSNAFGKIDLTGATFTGKNSYDNVANRVVAWPDGSTGTSYNVVRGSEAWNEIVSYWKGQLSQQLGVDIESADVESIILKPYKISDNERYHVDCTIDINCKKVVTAKYHLLDAGATQFDQVEAKTFKVNTGETQPQKNYPATKTVNNKIYTFVGWYDNEACTGTPVRFPYKVGSTNLDFYAKYVRSDLKYTVNYYEEGTTTKVALSKENKPAGTPGTIIREDAISVPGYTLVSNAQQQIVVKEDGKNEINFYYKKNSYQVSYSYKNEVPNASTLPTSSEHAYKDIVDIAAPATAPGYTFSGWRTDDVVVSNGKFEMPAKNVKLVGEFTANSNTKYTVEHYVENLEGTGYTLRETETDKIGVTGQKATAKAKTYAGFTYDPNVTGTKTEGTILGNGSLVLKLYYRRNSYKVTYEYNNTVAGASTLPAEVSYKYEEDVNVAGVATAPGYTFSGWKTDDATVSNGKFEMPAKNVKLVGGFTANNNTKYTVEHYVENLEGTGYTLRETETDKIGVTGQKATAEAKTYAGFTYDPNVMGTKTEGTILGNGSLVLKLYYRRNSYKVTYEYSNTVAGASTLPAEASYKYGADVNVAGAATAPGYTFSGWKTDDVTVSNGKFEMPANDVILAGGFIKNSYPYFVTYHYEDAKGNEIYADDSVKNVLAEFESVIPYNTTSPKKYAIDGKDHNFVLDKVVFGNTQGAGKTAIVTDVATKNNVDVYYALDELGTNPENPTNPNKPDGIADKYQIVFTYVADDHGTVTGMLKEVVTRYEGDKKFSTTAPAYPIAENIVATPDAGYKFVNWTSKNPSEASANIVAVFSRILQQSSATNAKFKDVAAIRAAGFTQDTEFTAHFVASDATTYNVEVYYEYEGKYSTVPSKTETLAGTTDTKATVAAETYLPTNGYVFDQNAGNVLEGTIAGDNSLVLKVYYKQVFKVTYAPGDHGSFKSQTYTVSYGDQTPEFSGDKTVNGNYRFTGWDKTIESRVTGDIVYTAQWAANSNGGGNGGGGGGSSSGGGGGSSSGPRDNGSTPSGGPGATTVTIDPDAVPLANLPNEDGAADLLVIDDEDVPLAALPKTGQSGASGLVLFLSSMMLAAFVAVSKKREDDK